jgi:hypothetical protein
MDETQIKKLANLITGIMTRQTSDFASLTKLIEGLKDLVKTYDDKFKNYHEKTLAGLEEKLAKIKHEAKGKDGVTPVKGKDYFTGKEVKEIVSMVTKLIPKPKDGEDGKSVDEEKVVKRILKLIPPALDGKDAEITEEVMNDLINFIEAKEGDERLDAKKLKNLEEALDISKLKLPAPTIVNRYQGGEFRRLSDTPDIIEPGKILQGSANGEKLEWTDMAGDGETNTASNVGDGTGVFKEKVGVDLRFKSLVAGDNVTFDTTDPDEIKIDASGGGGGDVDSVNGQTGVVTLDTDDIDEGETNLYHTNARAVSAIKADADWNADDWDTAFGWGNHASAGYALDNAVVKLTGNQTIAGVKTFEDDVLVEDRLLIGSAGATEGKLVVIGPTFPVANIIRELNTSSLLATAGFTARRSSTIPDGYGPAMNFFTQIGTGTPVRLGNIGVERRGANNTGHMLLETDVTGTRTTQARISSNGLAVAGGVRIGNVGSGTFNSPLDVRGNVGVGEQGLVRFEEQGSTAFNAISYWRSSNRVFRMRIDASNNIELIKMTGSGTASNDSLIRLTSAGLEVEGHFQTNNVQTLTDGASIAWNLHNGVFATVTLEDNRTLSNTTNQHAGGLYTLIVKQDDTGGRTLAYGNNYKFPGGVTPTLSSTANAVDILEFKSDGTNLYLTNAVFDLK